MRGQVGREHQLQWTQWTMNILSYPHGLHMVRKSTCQCRQFNYCNQICQVNRQNLKLYKCCWHGFNIIQRLFSHVKLSYNCGLQQCVAVWEETGVNFVSWQVFLMCAWCYDIINNLHRVNTFPNVHKTSPYGWGVLEQSHKLSGSGILQAPEVSQVLQTKWHSIQLQWHL